MKAKIVFLFALSALFFPVSGFAQVAEVYQAERGGVVVSTFPIRESKMSWFVFRTNIVDEGILAFAVSITNKTDKLVFLDPTTFVFRNCLEEKQIPIAPSQVETMAKGNTAMAQSIAGVFGGDFFADLAGIVSDDLDRCQFLRLRPLSFSAIPPGATVDGVVYFVFTNYEIIEKQATGDGFTTSRRVHLKEFPVNRSTLTIPVFGADGSTVECVVTLGVPTETIDLSDVAKRRKDAKPPRIEKKDFEARARPE